MGSSRNLILRGAVIAVAVALALGAWILTGAEPSGDGQIRERPVSVGELAEATAALGQPVYWAGRMAGARLVLIEFDEGVQVRYERPGEPAVEALTVGTYRLDEPEREIEEIAARPGAIVRDGAGGRRSVSDRRRPSSVFFADPAGGVEVEIYDPSPARAMSLATGSRVRPVG